MKSFSNKVFVEGFDEGYSKLGGKKELYFSEFFTLMNKEKDAETVMVYRSEKNVMQNFLFF